MFKKYRELRKTRPPLVICYEHLHAEYAAMKNQIDDAQMTAIIETYPAKLEENTLDWHDLYYLELAMAEFMPAERLRSKVQRMRYDFRAIVSPKAYDEYLASKPPDLQSPPEPTDPPHGSAKHFEALLRSDLKDLLGRLYLEYSMLPAREERLSYLSWFAANLCLGFLGLASIVLLVLFLAPAIYEIAHARTLKDAFNSAVWARLSSLTIFVVGLNGALGGFVSALQRIQTPPRDGNPIYNLSLLFYGSYSVFIAPITGAIFATILYLIFTAGMLGGSFFPEIYTPPGDYTATASVPLVTGSQTAGASEAPPVTDGQPSSGEAQDDATHPVSKSVPQRGLNAFDFLAKTGPGNGKHFALLLVWCFIAGFAERFVPDALDRIISKSGTTSAS